MRNFTTTISRMVRTGALVGLLAGASGCDDLLGSMLYAPDYGGYYGWGADNDGWGGYDGYGYDNYGYYDYGLYDPTDVIQGVVDYRQSVMESTANAWDAYIRE